MLPVSASTVLISTLGRVIPAVTAVFTPALKMGSGQGGSVGYPH